MEVKLDKRYPVAAGVDACWAVLGDVRAVAACMPGAQITEQLDETHFKGSVRSKVGPAVMTFNGDIELLARDDAARSIRLLGKGADKAGSSASMQLAAHVEAADGGSGSVLVGTATIVVSGKLAQFGSRLLVPVSDAMLAQFAEHFRQAASAAAANADTGVNATPAPAAAVGTAAAPPADGAAASPATPAAPDRAATAAAGKEPPSVAQVARPAPTPEAPPPAPVRELNALSLLWQVLKNALAGLFGRRRG
jgi:carbon monoxide dehydrogenase subunit G